MDEPTTKRVLSWGGLGIAVLVLAELIGTMTVGLAVDVKRMNFPIRQGYAFLTNLEKSPVGLALIIAAVFAAIAATRRGRDDGDGDDSKTITTAALWIVVAAGAILGVATILAVMARFRVAELVTSQPVDALTRRVLVVFVIRNFGAAIVAVLISLSVLFRANASPALMPRPDEPALD